MVSCSFHRRKKKNIKLSGSSQDAESDSSRSGSKMSKNSNENFIHLTELLEDRKQLHEQLFKVIPKKEVKGIMPDILKVR